MIKAPALACNRSIFWIGRRILIGSFVLVLLVSCRPAVPPPASFDPAINLDADTQAMIASARRVVFVIPFSHWDTDWHDTFDAYSRMADHNIQAAIELAKQQPRFRYTLEQVFFVQHFWQTHPESRADLKALVQSHQLTFAWAGITQPETSLAAPGVQWHNLLEGQTWIAETFGPEFVPRGAWQSDAFGNSAALPVFLSQAEIPYMFLGRYGRRCPSGQSNCPSLPQAFYWKSPLPDAGMKAGGMNSDARQGEDRILVASVPYATAWGSLLNQTGEEARIKAFKAMVEEQFQRSSSRYLFLPYGFDFLDPDPALMNLVDAWNRDNQETVLVVADPETAFQYLASEDLPEVQVDLNPLWQAFYGTRPYARIADKESEFYLTAADKFGQFLESPVAGEWLTATVNAHYDNLSAVGYDRVWAASQRPRFEAAVNQAADRLAAVLADISERVMTDNPASPAALFFNALSWPRGGVVEIPSELTDGADNPSLEQTIDPRTVAVYLKPLPATGYAMLAQQVSQAAHPVRVVQDGDLTTFTNGLVSVRLDAARGGTFDRLGLAGDPPIDLLTGPGDDLVYLQDSGDVYGARFGEEITRQSQSPARVDLLAGGPLLARARVTISLGGQPVTKTVTLRADSSEVEVTLQMRALPESSAIMRTSTSLKTDNRTDDLGFAAFEHVVDSRPIQPGDITYRRNIFYPITYWSDVSADGFGLSLITHGLEGVAGTGELTLLLARSVSDPGDQAHEGVVDTELHTFHYAFYPHRDDATAARPWIEAYSFNQPLIPVWRTDNQLNIQLPFQREPKTIAYTPVTPGLPANGSIFSTLGAGAVLVDAFQQAGQISMLVVNYEPSKSAQLSTTTGEFALKPGWLSILSR